MTSTVFLEVFIEATLTSGRSTKTLKKKGCAFRNIRFYNIIKNLISLP